MKSLLLILIASVATSNAAPLKSKTVKELICSRLESYAYDETNIDEADCTKKAKFDVTSTQYNPQIGSVSVMKVNFKYDYKKFKFSGKVEVFRTVNFDSNGEMVLGWNSRNFKAETVDNRSYVDVFNELFDNDDVNVHNGDAGIITAKPGTTEADLVKSLEESLGPENHGDSCEFSTVTGIDDVNYYMKDYSDDLYKLFKNMEKKGQIKAAAFRGFEDGESEYCSYYYFQILTNDGKIIYIDFDFTT